MPIGDPRNGFFNPGGFHLPLALSAAIRRYFAIESDESLGGRLINSDCMPLSSNVS